ncbi:MAG: CarD family transcriptional regulator, partial [Candidatus Binatota bacterium]|nr:CarD family transcriptional regulator [Candidatus Binatota bacterium]
MLKNGEFKVGEKVVYPAHGVGVIESLQTRNVSGTQKKFYMLRIVDSEMMIMIPTENVQTVGLRRVIGRDMVTKVYKVLREKKKVEVDQQTWNRRYREYTEKIKTG